MWNKAFHDRLGRVSQILKAIEKCIVLNGRTSEIEGRLSLSMWSRSGGWPEGGNIKGRWNQESRFVIDQESAVVLSWICSMFPKGDRANRPEAGRTRSGDLKEIESLSKFRPQRRRSAASQKRCISSALAASIPTLQGTIAHNCRWLVIPPTFSLFSRPRTRILLPDAADFD
jgi:hypothetical protein